MLHAENRTLKAGTPSHCERAVLQIKTIGFSLILLAACTLATKAQSADRIMAIPEMLARAQSSDVKDTVSINDQRLEFELIESDIRSGGELVRSYRQRYQGIPVWKERISTFLQQDGGHDLSLLRVEGYVVVNIAEDISTQTALMETSDLESVVRSYVDQQSSRVKPGWNSRQMLAHSPQLWIVLDSRNRARLAYEFCLLNESRDRLVNRVLIDAAEGDIIKAWDDALDTIFRDKHLTRTPAKHVHTRTQNSPAF